MRPILSVRMQHELATMAKRGTCSRLPSAIILADLAWPFEMCCVVPRGSTNLGRGGEYQHCGVACLHARGNGGSLRLTSRSIPLEHLWGARL